MPETSVVTTAFTELAPRYEATIDGELRTFLGVSYAEFVGRFIGHAGVHPGDRVLDIATGTAYIPAQICDVVGDGGQIVGLDITPAMLAHGAARIRMLPGAGRTRLICGSGLELPLADGVMDVALCGLGTHHIGVPPLLAELRRVLQPRGRLVVADVTLTAFWRSWLGRLALKAMLFGYGVVDRGSARADAEIGALDNMLTADEWRDAVSNAGFDQIAIEEIAARHVWFPSAIIVRAIRR